MAQPRLLLCDCTGTFAPDAKAIEAATGLVADKIHTHLCGPEAAAAAEALKSGPCLIACGQMAGAFADLAEDYGTALPLTADIRDRAGWSTDPSGPKQAALLAEALLARPPTPVMDVTSDGVCLVYGKGEQALAAGARLAETLSVTVMLTAPDDVLPPEAEMDIVTGRIAKASGALGGFSLGIDRFAELTAAGRGARAFAPPGTVRQPNAT